jgi:hypothetical protein
MTRKFKRVRGTKTDWSSWVKYRMQILENLKMNKWCIYILSKDAPSALYCGQTIPDISEMCAGINGQNQDMRKSGYVASLALLWYGVKISVALIELKKLLLYGRHNIWDSGRLMGILFAMRCKSNEEKGVNIYHHERYREEIFWP